MSSPDPVTVARRWLTLWQGAPLNDVDLVLAPDYVDHAPAGRSPDRAGVRAGLAALYAAFPDFHGVEEQMVAGSPPDLVAVTWHATGTHRGPFMGFPPTGRVVTFRGVEMIRVRDGLVVERWGEWDGEGLAAQLAS